MSFIETIAVDDAGGDVLDLYQRQQGSWGFVPNFAKSFCYRPAVMAKWAPLLAEIRRPMDSRRFELVTLAAALTLKHSYCSLAHGQKLSQLIDVDTVIELANGGLPESLSASEKAMVGFARKVASDASAVEQADVDRLLAVGLTAAEVFDIAATVAARAFLTKLSDALGALPDASFRDMGGHLPHALAVGRPISEQATERV